MAGTMTLPADRPPPMLDAACHGRPYDSLLGVVGRTPLVRLRRVIPREHAAVYVKCEFLNPLGSVKERAALAILEAAERAGEVGRDSCVIEPSSGNMAIALAFACAAKGYRFQAVMPGNVGAERRRMLRQLGADVVTTPAEAGMAGSIAEAGRLGAKTTGCFMPRQFSNPANPRVHFETTGEEIWRDLNGRVDAFVAGVGTGGTLSGVAELLKLRNPAVRAVAVEPAESPVIRQALAGEALEPGRHRIEGIGPGFIPDNLKLPLVDEAIGVESEKALRWARRLAAEEGMLVGASTGANVCAAAELAGREEFAGKVIVTVACSLGERYLTSPLFPDPDAPAPATQTAEL